LGPKSGISRTTCNDAIRKLADQRFWAFSVLYDAHFEQVTGAGTLDISCKVMFGAGAANRERVVASRPHDLKIS